MRPENFSMFSLQKQLEKRPIFVNFDNFCHIPGILFSHVWLQVGFILHRFNDEILLYHILFLGWGENFFFDNFFRRRDENLTNLLLLRRYFF